MGNEIGSARACGRDAVMKNDACIYFYHGCNWSDIPARQQYLMRAISRHVPVVFFDGGADRLWHVTIQQPAPNVTVVRGLTAVCQRLKQRGLSALARAYAAWHLRKLRRSHSRIIFWLAENWLRPDRFIQHDAMVYDCIDPCFSEDPRRIEIFNGREIDAMAAADVVFATADTLADFCRQHHSRVALINNACEPADYAPALLDAAPRPAWWPNTDKPIAAYLGSLDWRFDFAAVETACRELPERHFVLAGNALDDFRPHVQKLQALPNVTCPGRVSLEDGRYLLNHCAVGLIPFTAGKMNDAINPVKMYAYALLGKPIAGSRVRELTSRPDIASTAASSADFGHAVDAAMQRSRDGQFVSQLRGFASRNTWEHRAAQAWEEIRQLQ
jgi:hypothetical protein